MKKKEKFGETLNRYPGNLGVWLEELEEEEGSVGLAETILQLQEEMKNNQANTKRMFNHLNENLKMSLSLVKR